MQAQSALHAVVNGEAITSYPLDLYIPPEALEVFLETFEGPLDLLLYLIKKQNIDILNIPIAAVTRQYMEYITLMQDLKLELAAEYLVMAATLAEIKSRLLLPRPPSDILEDDSLDPRADLIRRLQQYERFKTAAQQIDEIPREGRDFYQASVQVPNWQIERVMPQISLAELLSALKDVYTRANMAESHHIAREPLSVRERMSQVLSQLQKDSFRDFRELFILEEGRAGVVVTFLAILELAKEALIEIVQSELFSPIHLRAVS